MRIQEFRDTFLLIHENHQVHDWSNSDDCQIPSVLDGMAFFGPRKTSPRSKERRTRCYWTAFAVWFFLVLSLLWVTSAGASYVERSAVDAIARTYRLPITDAQNGTTLPSVLNFESAALDTKSPANQNMYAANGQIYLSLHMSSGPFQSNEGDAHSGDFFSGMTPLPASALRYVAASGRSYVATRIDPISQINNLNALSDDGLVDAMYFFTVPITNRRGTLVILPTSIGGVEYEGFTGIASVELNIGGPTKIALRFPKKLAVTVPTPNKPTPMPGETFGNDLNLFATMLAGLMAGFVLLQRRRTNRSHRPVPVFVVGTSIPNPPIHDFEQAPTPRPPQVTPIIPRVVGAEETLRVDVLGPLRISPVNAPPSDPVRAIIAYLAINAERPYTLDEIQTAVWPLTDTGTDIKRPAMRNYMVDVRKVVGARHLPSASGRAGYQLKDFTTDWSEFQVLMSQAAKSASEEAKVLRHRALDLSTGPPFEADTRRYFTWTFTLSVVYKMIEAITTLARELSRDLVLTGDLVGSEAVLRQGLLVDSVSLTLWEDLTDVLLESTDTSLMDLHWKSASLVLRAEDVGRLRNRVNG
jgi:hypothetical protein